MAAVSRLPECDELCSLAEHKTNREIGEMFGTTGEAVRQKLQRCGYERRNRPTHAYFIPWVLRADHAGHILARRLRAYSKRQQGRPLGESESRLLDEWIRYMSGSNQWNVPLSVHYDRTDDEGFWLEPSRPGDRDFISPPDKAA